MEGRASLLEGSDLARLPQAAAFPEALWALVASGEGGGFAALLLGGGEAPAPLAEDPLLTAALLRRLGEAVAPGEFGPPDADEILARLSHELKTPLVSIKGYADLLLDRADRPLSERSREWVRRIAAGANRLSAVFDRVAAHARTDSPWGYFPGPVDPVEWVHGCVEATSALARDRELRWETDIPEGLGPVSLDRDAGRGILAELLQNAARSTPDGGLIRVRCRAEDRLGTAGVRFTVEDTGVGIPAGEAADRLFERFGSVGPLLGHHSGDFEFGAAGLGLGLATVRGVVRSHGGEVWAEGAGRNPETLPGAAFHLWLPLFRGGEPREERRPDAAGGRLLVVEPGAEARRILEEALQDDFAVVAVRTAPRALRLWAGGKWVGCVVEPCLSPGGGVELIRELRRQASDPGAVILTYSTASSAETSAWRAAGADGCVAKPARARVLAQRLRALRARRLPPG